MGEGKVGWTPRRNSRNSRPTGQDTGVREGTAAPPPPDGCERAGGRAGARREGGSARTHPAHRGRTQSSGTQKKRENSSKKRAACRRAAASDSHDRRVQRDAAVEGGSVSPRCCVRRRWEGAHADGGAAAGAARGGARGDRAQTGRGRGGFQRAAGGCPSSLPTCWGGGEKREGGQPRAWGHGTFGPRWQRSKGARQLSQRCCVRLRRTGGPVVLVESGRGVLTASSVGERGAKAAADRRARPRVAAWSCHTCPSPHC